MTDPTDRDSTLGDDIDQETLYEDTTVGPEGQAQDDQEPDDASLRPTGDGTGTTDYSLPEDDDPANQDDQASAAELRDVAEQEGDFPLSGDVSGGHVGSPGHDALAGAGVAYDDGVPAELRTEMLDNAAAYGEDFTPGNVNDEPSFDDGTPGSFSDFSVITPEDPDGASPRLADPSLDAGGEVKGPRVGGSGGIDGGPPRTRPLPGTDENG